MTEIESKSAGKTIAVLFGVFLLLNIAHTGLQFYRTMTAEPSKGGCPCKSKSP